MYPHKTYPNIMYVIRKATNGIHHKMYSPQNVFTTNGIHHKMYSPQMVFTTNGIHHKMYSPQNIFVYKWCTPQNVSTPKCIGSQENKGVYFAE